ncbi:hypothetical protein KC351_g2120 [Hortaea werneckii]|nr:hypothetical protein KC351_g2120 [Hortaea werneckii]
MGLPFSLTFALGGLGLPLLAAGSPIHSTAENSQLDLGNGFALAWTGTGIEITQGEQDIWYAATPFISASAGNDSVSGSNGAFNITEIDYDLCADQSVDAVQHVPWNLSTTGEAVEVSGQLLECGDTSTPYSLTLWVPSDLPEHIAFYIDVSQRAAVEPLKKLYFSYSSQASEDIYGLGGQASFASLKNQSVPVLTREQGVGRGDEPITSIENANGSFAGGNEFTTYTAIPSYITTEGNVFYLSEKSSAYANFDFTKPDEITMRYDSLSVDGAIAKGKNMFEAVERLTEATGRMPALPSWVDNGAILGIQGGQSKVNRIVQEGLNISCPIAGVWLQDWEGTHTQAGPYLNISRLWWNWENDEVLYPEWNEFVQNLRSEYDVRTLSYMNVFLTNVSTKEDGYRRNLYNEATELGYFVQNTTTDSPAVISSGPGLEAGIIDITNPDLREWFKDVLRTQVWNANISGYMSDFGEYTPVTSDTSLQNMVSDAFFFHNKYPLLWAEFLRSVIEEFGLEDEALIFHRSANTGANRYMNLFWVGDQNLNWGVNDGIKSVVTIMGHMGFSGYAQQHSDAGGYTDTLTYQGFNVTRSAELLGRWGELAAVSSPVFRSHEGNIPEVNAQFYSNASTYGYYAYNARMFVSLAAYRRSVLDNECRTKGWPLLRPPVMYHTADARAREISYQSYYLGPDLYVAPVLDPETFEVSVYLPGSGTFMHVWSGEVYDGGQDVTVQAPYGQPAVFVVDGAETPELEPFLEFVRQENETEITVE